MVCHLVCPVVTLAASDTGQHTGGFKHARRAKQKGAEDASLGGALKDVPSRPCCGTPRRETPGAWASGGVPDVRLRALPVMGVLHWA
jgi:hypothetical protein